MRSLLAIVRMLWLPQRSTLLRGWLLAVGVLLSGMALLGLSGWFITAAGVAGLLGTGATFDVFRPSAGVRFLALGRTVTRYYERVVTHDATLRTLATLRVQLLHAIMQQQYLQLLRMRGSQTLNQITADVDALDGLTLRLLIPVSAALASLLMVLAALAWLTAPIIAILTVVPLLLGGALVVVVSTKTGVNPARRAEHAIQQLRTRTVDLLRARMDLVMYGKLQQQLANVLAADKDSRDALQLVDRLERRAAFTLGVLSTMAATAALAAGIWYARAGILSPAQVGLAFFATLAMSEAIMPLRRSATEIGRMIDAAGRVQTLLKANKDTEIRAPTAIDANTATAEKFTSDDETNCNLRTVSSRYKSADGVESATSTAAIRMKATVALDIDRISYGIPGSVRPLLADFSLHVQPLETVALAGFSGSGKSTVLHLASRLITPDVGSIFINTIDISYFSEKALREQTVLLPQRSALLSGSVLETLRLADRNLSESGAWQVLEAVELDDTIRNAGGLSARLLEGGAGLSGGEQRRLCLARALLRKAPLLLLDEPTEGLDTATAHAVLAGIREYAANATVLVAAHREAELGWASRIVNIE